SGLPHSDVALGGCARASAGDSGGGCIAEQSAAVGVAAADEVDGIVVEGAGRTVGDLGCRIPVVGGCVCVSGGDCVSARFRLSDLLGDDRADGGEEARRGHLDAEEARTRHGHRRDVGMAAKRLGELLGDVMG
ncbi:hypothetical protein DN549_31830, partial [Burkholderia multivorans]